MRRNGRKKTTTSKIFPNRFIPYFLVQNKIKMEFDRIRMEVDWQPCILLFRIFLFTVRFSLKDICRLLLC